MPIGRREAWGGPVSRLVTLGAQTLANANPDAFHGSPARPVSALDTPSETPPSPRHDRVLCPPPRQGTFQGLCLYFGCIRLPRRITNSQTHPRDEAIDFTRVFSLILDEKSEQNS